MMAYARTWQAALLLIGTIVGVGMFGIPFVFARAGFLIGAIELLLIAAAVLLVHLAYAEVVLRTHEIHRLPGYVARYLPSLVWPSRLSHLFGLSGALLAYIVIGGFFLGELLHALLPVIPPAIGPVVFYLIGMAVIGGSIRLGGLVNGMLTIGLAAVTLILVGMLWPKVSAASLAAWHPLQAALPYGVLLFAMAGMAVIPDARRLLGPGAGRLGRIILFGTLGAAALYFLFAYVVVGATGEATTPDAISGLAIRFGPEYLLLGGLIGFLAAITSFIGLGIVLEGMLSSDFGIRPTLATILTAAIPAVLYALGVHDFIRIIGLVGAVAIGFDSIMVLILHRRIVGHGSREPEFRLRIPTLIRWGLVLVFGFGAVFEVTRLF